ncbi:hypothetical protein FLL77_11310 [Vibrio cholerae]|uniref:hypothetical protein n=1 Tax=Vibrio cholerae TaxID=666 RepID=UPI00115B8C93|nr:hypothetical protein [Vibrio cholerae]TQP97154.1 hypothetical protein FLL77_11310 [Vibrio cholerae]
MSELMKKMMTQEYFDEACKELKEAFDNAVEKSGYKSVAMAVSCGKNKKDIMHMMAFYELEVIPSAKKDGLNFKSSSELFGVKVAITQVSEK